MTLRTLQRPAWQGCTCIFCTVARQRWQVRDPFFMALTLFTPCRERRSDVPRVILFMMNYDSAHPSHDSFAKGAYFRMRGASPHDRTPASRVA